MLDEYTSLTPGIVCAESKAEEGMEFEMPLNTLRGVLNHDGTPTLQALDVVDGGSLLNSGLLGNVREDEVEGGYVCSPLGVVAAGLDDVEIDGSGRGRCRSGDVFELRCRGPEMGMKELGLRET